MDEKLLALEQENLELRKSLKKMQFSTIVEEKFIYPRDYEENRKLLKNATDRVKKLESLLNFGNVSQFADLINDYTVYSMKFLRKIIVEAHLLDFGSDEYDKIYDLIEFIDDMRIEFYSLLILQRDGKVIPKKDIRDCELLMKNIVKQFHVPSDNERLKAEKLAELYSFLMDYSKSLKKCMDV